MRVRTVGWRRACTARKATGSETRWKAAHNKHNRNSVNTTSSDRDASPALSFSQRSLSCDCRPHCSSQSAELAAELRCRCRSCLSHSCTIRAAMIFCKVCWCQCFGQIPSSALRWTLGRLRFSLALLCTAGSGLPMRNLRRRQPFFEQRPASRRVGLCLLRASGEADGSARHRCDRCRSGLARRSVAQGLRCRTSALESGLE